MIRNSLLYTVPLALFVSVVPSSHLDALSVADYCDPPFDPANTSLTVLGDSLGYQVASPEYGWASWETYFSMVRPEIDWHIQDLAIRSINTYDIYAILTYCTTDAFARLHFRTADNVALETGGNDLLSNLPILVYFPWSEPRVEERLNQNTRLLLKALRHPLRHKNVLVMGNFPLVSTSPTLGKVPHYFQMAAVQPDRETRRTFQDLVMKGWRRNVSLPGVTETFRRLIDELVVRVTDDLFRRMGQDRLSLRPTVDTFFGYRRCKGYQWYCDWMQLNSDNFGFNAVSIALMLHQGNLERISQEEGASFLPLYPLFIRERDCELGSCFVAKHYLYTDWIHINYLGYYLWSYHFANRVADLGWYGHGPANGTGLVDGVISNEPPPLEPVLQPDNNDILLLWCIAGGCKE